jgi:hypothetical protein
LGICQICSSGPPDLLRPQGDVELLGGDGHADGGQHPVDRRGREEVADDVAQLQHPQQQLDQPGRHANGQRVLVGLLVLGGALADPAAERDDGAQRDDDQAGGRALDGQLGVADERGQDPADDGGVDPGDQRVAARQGDAQAQGQRDEEHQEAGQQVGLPVLGEPGQPRLRDGGSRLHRHKGSERV